MTFHIDWFEADLPLCGRILRIRDDTRYVQDMLTDEMVENMPRLSRYERQGVYHALLKVLCRKWLDLFGEYIEPVAPEAEGQGWGIRRREELDSAPRNSIEAR
jgi:hypothetical protein